MNIKILCCQVLLIITYSIHAYPQDGASAAPQSTISLSVVIPDENLQENVSPVQLTRLKTRVINMVTQNGLSADGSNDGFVIYPVFQVYDLQQSQSTMRAITLANCTLALYIKQVVQGSRSNIIFDSYSTDVQGSGMSKEEAITNAMQQVKPGDPRIQNFFANAKIKIVSYYVQNCDKITKAAENAANVENYGKAFSLLLSIPTEAKQCNDEVQQKLTDIYLRKQKKDCAVYISAAKTFAANQEYDSALIQLRKVDPESVCKEDLWNTINNIELKVDAQKRAEWEFTKEMFHNAVELEKARISSANEWAKTWMTGMGKRQYRIEKGAGSDIIVSEEFPSGLYTGQDAKTKKPSNLPRNTPSKSGTEEKTDRSSSELLLDTDFKPHLLFENNIFPSFIISQYSYNDPETLRTYGDVNSCIGLQVMNKNAGGTLFYEIIPTENKYFDAVKGSITFSQNQEKIFFPDIPWKYDALRNVQQSTPLSVTFRLYDNNGKAKEAVTRLSFHSIKECVTMFVLNGKLRTTQLLAAYVNEENPQIEKLKKEAIEKDWVDAWDGYQSGEKGVLRQVEAVWKIIASKGVKYSDMTGSTSNVANTFFSQAVRSFCQSIYNKQANCVDGTLVFASILKNIGLRPVLVLIPHHCFLAFHTTESNSDEYFFLETTMIGNYTGKPDENAMSGNFVQAMDMGKKKYLETDKDKITFIDIQAARQQQVRPINPSEDECK